MLILLLPALASAAGGQVQLEPRDKRHLPAGWSPAAAAADDLDGDGDPDLVVRNAGQLELHRNDGGGIFRRSPGLASALFAPCEFDYSPLHKLLLADVDGDRDQDVLFLTCEPVLFLNDGRGSFRDASSQLPRALPGHLAACAGDIDRDGDVDLITGATSSTAGTVLLNDGTGRFAIASGRLPSVYPDVRSLLLADVDGDGDADLVATDARFTGQSAVWLNDGRGTFLDASSRLLPGPYGASRSVAAADVDGDGRVDLLLCSRGAVVLLVNTASGVFSDRTAQALPPWTDGSASVVLARDVDLDGDADAVVTVFGSQQGVASRIYLNDGAVRFADGTAGRVQPPGLEGMLLVDVDGDRDLDALCPGLSLNDGRGVFQPAQPSRFPWSSMIGTELAVADIDGNGSLDLVRAGGSSETPGLEVLLHLGHGHFVRPSALPSPMPVDQTGSPRLVDLDGDGRRDLVFWSSKAGLRIYGNAGAGSFVDVSQKVLPGMIAWGPITPLDADGDGDLDLLVAALSTDRLLLNDGQGRLQDATRTHLPDRSRAASGHVAADFDGDRDLDVVVLDNLLSMLLYYENRGLFVLASSPLPGLGATERIVAADFDRDGDVDLVAQRSGKLLLYANDGSARFTDLTVGRVPHGVGVRDFVLADFDLDGDDDVLVATPEAPQRSGDLRGMRALREEHAVEKAILVAREDRPRRTDDGIDIWPWQQFCRALWSDALLP